MLAHARRNVAIDKYPSYHRRKMSRTREQQRAKSVSFVSWVIQTWSEEAYPFQLVVLPQRSELMFPRDILRRGNFAAITAAHVFCRRQRQSPQYSSAFCKSLAQAILCYVDISSAHQMRRKSDTSKPRYLRPRLFDSWSRS